MSDIKQTDNTTTRYNVSWTTADGNFDGYFVECICTEEGFQCDSDTSIVDGLEYECISLTPGSKYISRVSTVRLGWDMATELAPVLTQTGEFISLFL